MEETLKIIILALIQGVTEFLPISSSGHLVIFKDILDLPKNDATLEITLHAGTLFSILIFYRLRILNLLRSTMEKEKSSLKYISLIIISVLPAGLLGFFYGDFIEAEIFSKAQIVSILLIITGLYLIFSQILKPINLPFGKLSAILIGFSQMIALLPGISRSGATIGTARLLGINAKKSAEFSFLMAIPLLLAVILYKIIKTLSSCDILNYHLSSLLIGFFISAIVGYFALSWLVSLLQKGKFWYFGIYCIILGASYFFYSFIN